MLNIPLASTGLRQQDLDAAIVTLNSGYLTMGKEVKAFEAEMAKYLGVKHFVMVNSGSSANLAIFEALLRPANSTPRLKQGDSVLVPAIAWPTTIWPIIQLGLDPVFVDVDPETLALDLKQAEKIILESQGKNFAGIFPIHPLGLSLDEQEYLDFANKHGLVLLSDVCESLGAFREGKAAGSLSLASSYSFYFSHHLTTMEGGGVATNDDEIADDLRSIRSHGWSRDRSDVDVWSKDVSANDSKFLFVTTGYNIRPMEIQASIGLSQIGDLNNFVANRRRIAKRVYESLKNTSLSVIDGHHFESKNPETHSWMLIAIRVHGDDAFSRRSQILEKLSEKGVETRPVLTGNFLAQPSVRRIFGHLPHPEIFPVATDISKTCFLVGAHHDLTDEQIDYLCGSLAELA